MKLKLERQCAAAATVPHSARCVLWVQMRLVVLSC